jgi:hypothetical protein
VPARVANRGFLAANVRDSLPKVGTGGAEASPYRHGGGPQGELQNPFAGNLQLCQTDTVVCLEPRRRNREDRQFGQNNGCFGALF